MMGVLGVLLGTLALFLIILGVCVLITSKRAEAKAAEALRRALE